MKPNPGLATLIERFFTERLMRQRHMASHDRIVRDTFRLLFRFVQTRLHKSPEKLELPDLDAPLISAFLDDIEEFRPSVSVLVIFA